MYLSRKTIDSGLHKQSSRYSLYVHSSILSCKYLIKYSALESVGLQVYHTIVSKTGQNRVDLSKNPKSLTNILNVPLCVDLNGLDAHVHTTYHDVVEGPQGNQRAAYRALYLQWGEQYTFIPKIFVFQRAVQALSSKTEIAGSWAATFQLVSF